ncbi:cell surface protein [Weeksella virosa]|uniref:cell surface protein n=1 Tax=Weeksella virosa TaxID=1014 RepID=UPI002552477D|nr:cell surface protein [Weeksella virosa]MDK7375081.1 cell surface protein [Weeksella virosa]
MNKKYLLYTFLPIILLQLQSCSSDDSNIENLEILQLKDSYTGNRLTIIDIEPIGKATENTIFTWRMNDSVLANTKQLAFISDKVGKYKVDLEIKTPQTSKVLSTNIIVQQESKPYRKYIAKVYDYAPAVGQFTNVYPAYETGDTKEKMIEKASKAIVGSQTSLLTLGGFGGYVVFGFDHTIMNKPNVRDFKILGNAFWGDAAEEARAGSCEPGIIMVAYDKNKNGKPDEDEWYEIAGSEYHNPSTIKNYSITYYKPEANHTPTPGPNGWDMDIRYIRWEDNQGNTGYKTQNIFNTQAYYPLWIPAKSITFSGTRLPDNFYDQSGVGNYWVGRSYAYGYADNAPNNDEASNIDISWAVDKNGNYVHLPGIDFIKVYTGINQEAGWLGEVSTEIIGAYDLHLN